MGGGAQRQLFYLATSNIHAKHEVHVAYLSESPVPRAFSEAGFYLHPLYKLNNYDPRILLQLVRLIRSIKPDLIQTWVLQMDVLGGVAALISDTPWILRESTCAEFWHNGFNSKLRGWLPLLRQRLGSRADAIVSNAVCGDRYWENVQPQTRRFVVGNALPDKDAMLPADEEPEDLELPAGRPIVMFGSRLVSDKRPDIFVHAMARVVREFEATGIICGGGPLHSSLRTLIDDLDLGKHIRLCGEMPSLWAPLKVADLFVSITRFEGRPNSIMEAIACRCPVVVSDIAAHRELLADDMALFVRRHHDPDCVAEAILTALRDLPRARRRSEIAFQQINRWNVPLIAEQYERAYAAVLSARCHNVLRTPDGHRRP